jgi:flagellar FliL protein
MTDENADAVKVAAAGGKKKPLMIVGIVLVLAIGGAGAWFFLIKGEAKPSAAEHASADGGEDAASGGHGGAEGGEKGGDSPLSERLISLDPFVVNLDDGGYKRFLKTRIELETRSPGQKAKLVTRTAQMRDAIIVLLTSKRVEDLGGFEGKVVLKSEIERRLNDVLGEGEIQSVLITEFVIQ